MTNTRKLSLTLVVVAAVALLTAAMLTGDDPPADEAGAGTEQDERLVRPDSPRLSEGTEATFVEFLDFECEACAAVYPAVEDLRDRYGDRITFVVRHMPLHTNSLNAARAAEAAAEQGQFEAMYHRLFETPDEWGHQSTSQEATFFAYAEELGLDMPRFRTAFDDPATLERIEQSEQDGRALGVAGTPTFFLDGERLDPTSLADLEASLDAALAD